MTSPKKPLFHIVRETSGEVRGCVNCGQFQAVVHPSLGVAGGVITDFLEAAVTNPAHIAPRVKLYLVEGRLVTAWGQVIAGIIIYAMGAKETYDDARVKVLGPYELVTDDA